MERRIGFQNGKSVERPRHGEQDTESSSFKASDLPATLGNRTISAFEKTKSFQRKAGGLFYCSANSTML